MIFIDNIVFSTQRIGGISVVWYEYVSRLLKNKKIDSYFIEYLSGKQNILRKSINIPSSRVIVKSSRLLAIKKFFNIKINCSEPFIFHSSDYRIAKNHNAINIITVHDFIYFISNPKGIKNKFSKWIHCYQMSNAIKRANYLICISNNTKKDLLEFFPVVNEEKVSVIYNGVSNEYFPISSIKNSDLPYKIHSYVLFVGSRSKYKNFNLTVDAVANTEFSLVILGKSLNKEEEKYLNQKIGEYRYTCMSNLDNSKLNILYNGAFCLLYPSSYEGFGIPVIEAQKSGCPVIASNSSSIPEIIGNTPLLLNEISIESIHDCFRLLKDKSMREQIINNGLLNSKRFSWDSTYEQIRNLILELEKSIK